MWGWSPSIEITDLSQNHLSPFLLSFRVCSFLALFYLSCLCGSKIKPMFEVHPCPASCQ